MVVFSVHSANAGLEIIERLGHSRTCNHVGGGGADRQVSQVRRQNLRAHRDWGLCRLARRRRARLLFVCLGLAGVFGPGRQHPVFRCGDGQNGLRGTSARGWVLNCRARGHDYMDMLWAEMGWVVEVIFCCCVED